MIDVVPLSGDGLVLGLAPEGSGSIASEVSVRCSGGEAILNGRSCPLRISASRVAVVYGFPLGSTTRHVWPSCKTDNWFPSVPKATNKSLRRTAIAAIWLGDLPRDGVAGIVSGRRSAEVEWSIAGLKLQRRRKVCRRDAVFNRVSLVESRRMEAEPRLCYALQLTHLAERHVPSGRASADAPVRRMSELRVRKHCRLAQRKGRCNTRMASRLG